MLKYFSTFTGIGGFEIGIHKIIPDAVCVGYSEIDKHAIRTYEEHYDHRNFGDITAINPPQLPDFDLLVGGFPCQAFSVAGKRRGFEEARGTLFFDIARILEHKRPRHLVLENVKGLLNHNAGQTFQTILRVLTELGYDVEWQLFNSKGWGVPQRRERVYIIGHLRDGSVRKILPIGKENIGDIKASSDDERGEERFIKTRHLSQNGSLISKAITLQATEVPHVIGTINRGSFKETDGVSLALGANYFKGHDNHGARPVVLDASYPNRVRRYNEVAPTVTNYGSGGNKMPMVVDYKHPSSTTRRGRLKEGSTGALDHDVQMGVLEGARIRRLTPIECERLQGFPDNWTIGSDTQRYKQCGNAVTTNVVEAVMRGIFDGRR